MYIIFEWDKLNKLVILTYSLDVNRLLSNLYETFAVHH